MDRGSAEVKDYFCKRERWVGLACDLRGWADRRPPALPGPDARLAFGPPPAVAPRREALREHGPAPRSCPPACRRHVLCCAARPLKAALRSKGHGGECATPTARSHPKGRSAAEQSRSDLTARRRRGSAAVGVAWGSMNRAKKNAVGVGRPALVRTLRLARRKAARPRPSFAHPDRTPRRGLRRRRRKMVEIGIMSPYSVFLG